MSPGGASDAPQTLRWRDDAWVPEPAPDAAAQVADSWLVEDGLVRAGSAHRARFRHSVEARGGDGARAAAAIAALGALVPERGRWFPRIDLAGGELVGRLRVAPAGQHEARIVTADRDPRTEPAIKGPDLDACLALRSEAELVGVSEAIILDEGAVVDGTTSAILWWRGETLCEPARSLERVDSITAGLVRRIADELGVPVRGELATPADIAGCEVWILSALHGIRGVTAWQGGPVVAAPARAPAWQRRLEAVRRPWM